jgi:hypothetical protein
VSFKDKEVCGNCQFCEMGSSVKMAKSTVTSRTSSMLSGILDMMFNGGSMDGLCNVCAVSS